MTPRRGAEPHGRARALKALLLAGACIALLASRLRRPGSAPTADQQPARCSHWAATDSLGGGCIAALPPGVAAFPCCSGGSLGPSCPACGQHLIHKLQCSAPRQMLLRPQPGCGMQLLPRQQLPPPPPPPQLPCSLVPASLAGGSWVTTPPGVPAAPRLSFRPAAPCQQQQRVGSAEVPACLWAAGFDRVVVSGDSTARQLYTRLIGLIRQQPQVIDAGASLVYAHYTLAARKPTAGAPPGSSSTSGGSSGDGSSSGEVSSRGSGGHTSSSSSSPIFTDSLWFSPPGNTLPGQFNLTRVAIGLQHLLLRTTAAAAQAASEAADLAAQAGGMQPGVAAAEGEAAAAAAAGVGSRQLTLDFIVGPLSEWQQKHVREYLHSPLWPDAAWRHSTLLLLSLCVWEQEVATPKGWLEFIEEVRQQVGQVVLLTCPTDRFRTAPKEAGRAVVAQRNEIVRRLVADSWSRGGGTSGGAGSSGRGGSMHAEGAAGAAGGGGSSGSSTAVGGGTAHRPRPLLLLDLDALTKEGLPPGLQISADDYHYQCYPSTSSGFANGSLAWAGGDGSSRPHYPPRKFEFLQVPASGSCADPVNYAAWQLLLGALCNGT